MVENAENAENVVNGDSAGPAVLKERRVEDAATLKALADPLRLAILDVLMAAAGTGPLTAKEIAAALDEPQTKLYRHIKQLEKAGLIRVAGTRLVSGIVESRYSPAQESLRLAPEIFSPDSPTRIDAYDAMLAAMDRVRGDFRAHAMAGRVDFSPARDGSGALPGLFSHFTYRVTPERMVRLRSQLAAVFDELNAEGNSTAEDAVDVTLFTLLYGVGPVPADGSAPAPVAGSRNDGGPGTES
ncbi:ArsR/SmtB family transcription factor [Kitasatospora purpeofusca]|uniref:Helix-turn-helix domain-containing protein n=1 Tax=Kitasatospora purpeofusca TaxID=67352 RepID=A0ABZ1U6P7_9ACTN|nr:helix-turn-helix domain-containing protein [Kitasatospora purpeofusca]